MEFGASPSLSVGLEIEFQLVDRESFDLVDGIIPLMEHCRGQEAIRSEFLQSTVEVASPPAGSIRELVALTQPLIQELLATCDRLGMALCGAGSHPFHRLPASFTPGARYAAMEEFSGWLGHNQVTFATHVHLGVGSGDEALRLMAELKPYLPLLIALSASSPYWHGCDTRFAAFRQRVLAASRTYGLPPDFSHWAQFEQFLRAMSQAHSIASIKDLHWDIRPQPAFGTVEVRVMDSQATLADAVALAALLRALARFLQRSRGCAPVSRPLAPIGWWSLKDNCYAASRFGADANLIVDGAGAIRSVRELAAQTFAQIRPEAAADELPYLERLEAALASALPYERQRHLFASSGSLQGVVAALVEELRREQADCGDAAAARP